MSDSVEAMRRTMTHPKPACARRRRCRRLMSAAVTVVLLAAGCGPSDGVFDGSDQTTLTVFAAASLTQTFTQIAEEFERQHESVDVKLSFGGSSDLVAQIRGGARADVFASADTTNMDKLADLADGRQDFASNTLEIVVPSGNPARIRTFADLGRNGVKLVVCAPEVPCGSASEAVAAAAGVELEPVSREQSVTDVLGKVSSGEADAGLVYVTDVTSAGGAVEGIGFPEAAQVVNTYPIAVVEGSRHATIAEQFLEFVLGNTGQRLLADAGFAKPR